MKPWTEGILGLNHNQEINKNRADSIPISPRNKILVHKLIPMCAIAPPLNPWGTRPRAGSSLESFHVAQCSCRWDSICTGKFSWAPGNWLSVVLVAYWWQINPLPVIYVYPYSISQDSELVHKAPASQSSVDFLTSLNSHLHLTPGSCSCNTYYIVIKAPLLHASFLTRLWASQQQNGPSDSVYISTFKAVT